MWKYIAGKILRNKLIFLFAIALVTTFMIYETCKIKLSYDFARVLPVDDPAYVDYLNFKKKSEKIEMRWSENLAKQKGNPSKTIDQDF